MGQSRMDNPEILATLGTQYIGQIIPFSGIWLHPRFYVGGVRVAYLFSLMKYPVSRVANVANISRLSILDCPIGFL
jgi:hypothetical protein